MPKAKVSDLQGLRIELQETERGSLELIAISNAVKNVGQGIGSIITPFLQMSATSGVLFGAVLTAATTHNLIEKALDEINPILADSPMKSAQVRIGTSPAFVSFVSDFQNGMKSLGFNLS